MRREQREIHSLAVPCRAERVRLSRPGLCRRHQSASDPASRCGVLRLLAALALRMMIVVDATKDVFLILRSARRARLEDAKRYCGKSAGLPLTPASRLEREDQHPERRQIQPQRTGVAVHRVRLGIEASRSEEATASIQLTSFIL